jgi:hypothetical protein
MRKKRTGKTKSKPPKRDQAWFERKVAELKAALENCRRNGRKNCYGNLRSGIDRRVLKKNSLFLRPSLVSRCAVCGTKARAFARYPTPWG